MRQINLLLAGTILGLASPAFADHSTHLKTMPAVSENAAATASDAAAQPAKPWFDISGLPAPKLADDLGNHAYPITTQSDEARRFFNQGLILAYGFNQQEALRAFRHAQTLDPTCAMCFWGEAYVLGPNLNIPMDPASLEMALSAARKAVEASANGTDVEKALTQAMLTRYDGTGERPALDRAYADAMIAVATAHPDDSDIATFAAESLMLLSPWDYWLDEGKTPKPETAQAKTLLEAALKQSPEHIGAVHFYIHLVEASDKPHLAEQHSESLRTAVPGSGHLVHMPSHIFLRTGRYGDAYEDNRKAAAADEKYIAENKGVHGPYPLLYYPHNVHFTLTAAMMTGRAEEALEQAKKLSGLIPAEAGKALPPLQPIIQAPYFAYAQLATPEEILALPEPEGDMPFVDAAWHYARGIAFMMKRDFAAAEKEAVAIDAVATGDNSALEEMAVPATAILQTASNSLRARILAASGQLDEAKRHAEAAVETEKTISYMEPPYWYMPVHQTLGSILLAGNDSAAAAKAFDEALRKAPNSIWALHGLHKAQAMSDKAAAGQTEQKMKAVLETGAEPPALDRF